jgi:DoxX-like family
MTTSVRPMFSIPGSPATVRNYWIATGLFTLLFVSSIVLTLSDLNTSFKSYAHLGFPAWSVYFNATGKILGLIAIYWNRSRTLKDFAFAGFLFDLLLALSAHIAQREADVFLAAFGLVLWGFAFFMNRKVFPVDDRVEIHQP